MITAQKVEDLFMDCLFNKEELMDGMPKEGIEYVMVEGIMGKFGFSKERLEGHREEIKSLLAELPEKFREDKGGGWSFLAAPSDKDGNLWGQQRNAEQLITMAIGLNLAIFATERKLWDLFPGGMPYIIIKKDKENTNASV